MRLVDVMGRTGGQGQGQRGQQGRQVQGQEAPTGPHSAPGLPEGAIDDGALLARRRQALVHQLAVAPGEVLGFDVRVGQGWMGEGVGGM